MREELERIKRLLLFCDQTKVYFREQKNTLAEELFSHLEYKVGMMHDMIFYYVMVDISEGHPLTKRYHGEDAPVNEMKIYEVQNLVLPHFISIIESSFRQLVLEERGKELLILNQILEHLFMQKRITKNQLHLWSGIRQVRNAVVHYDGHARISDSYHYSDELVLALKENRSIYTTDLFQALKLMEWMAYNVREIVHT